MRQTKTYACTFSLTAEAMPDLQEELLNDVKAILQAEGQHTDCRAHAEPPADPVPEAKHVVGADAECCDQLLVGADRDHVLCDAPLACAGNMGPLK